MWWHQRRPVKKPDVVYPHGYGRTACPFCGVAKTWGVISHEWARWQPCIKSCTSDHRPWGRCRGLDTPHVHLACTSCWNEWLTEIAERKGDV